MQRESLGPAVRLDGVYRHYWSYIPHFIHTPFYVYAYAFGDCLVNSLYAAYQDAHQGFAERYIPCCAPAHCAASRNCWPVRRPRRRHGLLVEGASEDFTLHPKWNSSDDTITGNSWSKEACVTTYTFKIVVEPDEDRWRAYYPALEAQGAATWGRTREEALQNIREVLKMIVVEIADEGQPLPANAAVSEEPLVTVTV